MRRFTIPLCMLVFSALLMSCTKENPSFALTDILTGWEKCGYVYVPYVSFQIVNNGNVNLDYVGLDFLYSNGESLGQYIDNLSVGETRGPFRDEGMSISSQQYRDLQNSMNIDPFTVEVVADVQTEGGSYLSGMHYRTLEIPVPLRQY